MAADLLSLVFQIKATDDGASAQIQSIQNAFRDLQTAAESLLPSLEAIKETVSGFGVEFLATQLETVQTAFHELGESAGELGPALEEFREELTGIPAEELTRDIGEVETALHELKDASEETSSGALAESIQDSVEELQETVEKGAGTMPAIEQGMEGATGAADALAQVMNGELQDGFTGLLALGGPVTASMGKFATQLAANSPAMAATVTGLAAVTAALLVSGVAAADAGAHIYDLSLVTNLSAEALSGLRVAAELGGSSLDTIANAFVRLQRQVAEGSPEVLAALELFGLTAEGVMSDLEGSIDQFLISFNNMEPSVQRTAAVMQLFGRNGAALVPVFAEMEKGLAAVTQEAKDLGVAFDESAAKKADRVDDALTKLTLAAKGLLYELGRPFLDGVGAATEVLEKLEKAGYKADLSIQNLTKTIFESTPPGWVLSGFIALKDVLEGFSTIKPPELKGITDLEKLRKEGKPVPGAKSSEQLRREFELEKEREFAAKVQKVYDDARAEAAKKRPKGGGGARTQDLEAAQLELNRIQRAMRDAESQRQQDQEAAARNLGKNLDTYAAYYEERVRIENEFYDTALGNIEKQRQLIQQDKGLLPRQRADALEALAQREKELFAASARNQQQFNDDRVAAEQRLVDAMEKLYAEDIGNKLDADAKKKKAGEDYNEVLRKLLFDETKIREDAAKDAAAKTKAQEEQRQADIKVKRQVQLDTPESNINIFGVDPDGEMTRMGALKESVLGGLSEMTAGFGTFKDFVGGALNTVAAAASQVIQQFILTGKIGGAAFRKLAADVISALAAEAAVKSLFYLAEGVANLIFNPPAAAKSFLAAKIYGAVAIMGGIAAASMAAFGGGGGGGGLGGATNTGFGGDAVQQTPREITLGTGDATGQIGGVPTEVWGQVIHALEENTAASQKIMSQPAGEVFVQGAAQRPDAAATAVVTHANTNADFVNQFGRVILGPG